MKIDEAINGLAQVKKYTNKKPPIEDVVEIVESANNAFTHGNVHMLSFTVIDDKNIIKAIADGCRQRYIEKAPYVIVITSNDKQVKRLFDKRAEKYIKHHAGAAAENFLLKARSLGFSGSWVGAFSEPTISSAIGIEGDSEVEMIITLGYGMEEVEIARRKKPELTGRLFFNSFGNRFYKPLKKLRRSDM